jgi:hypothetical protein
LPYKDANKLKRSKIEDLTQIELAEFEMYAGIEVDALMARLANASRDFKLTVVEQLYRKLV